MTQKAKLKWHCRRGMRELDLLLEGFLVNRYEALSAADRAGFERLLDCRNEDLMTWLIDGGFSARRATGGNCGSDTSSILELTRAHRFLPAKNQNRQYAMVSIVVADA